MRLVFAGRIRKGWKRFFCLLFFTAGGLVLYAVISQQMGAQLLLADQSGTAVQPAAPQTLPQPDLPINAKSTGSGAGQLAITAIADSAANNPSISNATIPPGLSCPANMQAYWRLQEDSGPTFRDLFNNYDGTCAGSCPTATAGRVNNGQLFNNTNTGINLPMSLSDPLVNWEANSNFSIELWMKSAPGSCGPNNEVMIGRDDTAAPPSELHWWIGCSKDTGYLRFRMENIIEEVADLQSTKKVNDLNWHHIVGWSNGNTLKLFVDGAEVAAAPIAFTQGFQSLGALLNIGWINLSHGFHFAGTLDEVAIYDRALSTQEISQHYQQGLAAESLCVGPDLIVDKKPDVQLVITNSTANFSIDLFNNSTSPALTGVQVEDLPCDSPPSGPTGDNGNGQLETGEIWSYTCSIGNVTTVLTNTVVATATLSGGGTITNSDSAVVKIVQHSTYLPLVEK